MRIIARISNDLNGDIKEESPIVMIHIIETDRNCWSVGCWVFHNVFKKLTCNQCHLNSRISNKNGHCVASSKQT
jgi:hypothetical protein